MNETHSSTATERVCAVVVTYNRRALLRDCLLALRAQTRSVDTVLVVDNASTDDTRAMLRDEFAEMELLELPRNIGGAGGFHAGMQQAVRAGFDWMWIMDDDGRPAPDCLQQLFATRRASEASIMVPVQRDRAGREYGFARWNRFEVDVTENIMARERGQNADEEASGIPVFRFVGPLIRREVVERVGLPNPEFFIWFDDIEWSLRVDRLRGGDVSWSPRAVMHHDFLGATRTITFLGRTSVRSSQPAWKTYYWCRNSLYALTRNGRPAADLLRYASVQARALVGDLIYEPDRWKRTGLRLRGLRDGALGRMGKRVQPSR